MWETLNGPEAATWQRNHVNVSYCIASLKSLFIHAVTSLPHAPFLSISVLTVSLCETPCILQTLWWTVCFKRVCRNFWMTQSQGQPPQINISPFVKSVKSQQWLFEVSVKLNILWLCCFYTTILSRIRSFYLDSSKTSLKSSKIGVVLVVYVHKQKIKMEPSVCLCTANCIYNCLLPKE